MKKPGLTFFFSLFSMLCFCQSMSDSLEIAYINKDIQLSDHYFKNWVAESKWINGTSYKQLPEIEKDIYDIFENLYSLPQLKYVDGVNGLKPIDPNIKYFVIPDVIYYNVFETLDKKELIKKHLREKKMSDTAYESELKCHLNDTAVISIPMFYYDDMILIHTDSIFNFRPRIYIKGTEILSLTSKREALIQDFFNDKDSMIDLSGFKYRKLKKDWADRKQFIEGYIEVALWNGNHWIIESNPCCHRILFDKNRQTAILHYRVGSSGGVILYKKENGSWKYISSDIYINFD